MNRKLLLIPFAMAIAMTSLGATRLPSAEFKEEQPKQPEAPTEEVAGKRVEYFLDTDPGYGLAKAIGNIQVGNNQLTFDLSDAPAGAHVLYVRSRDEEGRWSSTMSRPLFIDRLQDVVRVEYFFDGADPGAGQATPLPLPEQSYKAHLNWTPELNISALQLGEHSLSVRALDAFGVWTDVMTRTFTIVEADVPEPPVPEADLQRLEYFFDTDPGYGQGHPLATPSTGRNVYEMSFEGVETGAHVLYLRAQDKQSRWSATLSRPLYVCPIRGIAQIEYFFDSIDPGEGKAIQVSVADSKATEQAFTIDVNSLTKGDHTISIRVKGLDGLWTKLCTEPFSIVEAGTGIVSVEWMMPVRIYATKGKCIVEDLKDSNRGACLVEAFDMAGHLTGSASWPANVHAVSLNATGASVLLIKVTDTEHGRQLVKRIWCR